MVQTSSQSHATLKVLLAVLCVLIAIGGVVCLFATRLVLLMLNMGDTFEAVVVLLYVFKAIGVLALFIAYLLYQAARDPVRNVAIVDGTAGLILGGGIVDIFALVFLHVGVFYPTWLILTRILTRIAIATALIVLRPRGTGT